MRECKRCGERKDDEGFSYHFRPGLRSKVCRKCRNAADYKRVQKRREVYGSSAYLNRRRERIKRSAKKRGYSFNLKTADMRKLYESKTCYYCDNPFSREVRWSIPSVDRVDVTRGYEVDNVVLCCFGCNLLKARVEGAGQAERIRKILLACNPTR